MQLVFCNLGVIWRLGALNEVSKLNRWQFAPGQIERVLKPEEATDKPPYLKARHAPSLGEDDSSGMFHDEGDTHAYGSTDTPHHYVPRSFGFPSLQNRASDYPCAAPG